MLQESRPVKMTEDNSVKKETIVDMVKNNGTETAQIKKLSTIGQADTGCLFPAYNVVSNCG